MYNKHFNVLVIDDDDDIKHLFLVVENELRKIGYEVKFDFMHYLDTKNIDTSKFEIDNPYDVVVFDCTFNASDFMKYKEECEPVGYTLIRKFRKGNHSTKVILYSGTFDLENEDVPFTRKHLISIINELGIFRILEKDARTMVQAIKEAIDELDMIMVSIEDIYKEYKDDSVSYVFGDKEVSLEELVRQFKMGGQEADELRKQIIKNILHFMLDFK